MKKYVQYFRLNIISQLKYPVDLLSGILDKIVMAVASFFLWYAAYPESKIAQEMNISQILIYIILANVLSFLFNNGKDREIAKRMKNGDIAVDLTRPVKFQIYIIMRSIAESVSKLALFAIGIILVLKIVFQNYLLNDFLHIFAFICSILLGICLQAEFDFCIGVLSFWFINYWGLSIVKEAILSIFSGTLFPLELLGGVLQRVAEIFPFRYMVAVPIYIALGMNSSEIAISLIEQILWISIFYLIGAILYKKAIKRITIMGG